MRKLYSWLKACLAVVTTMTIAIFLFSETKITMTVKLNTDPSIKKILFLGGWKPYYDGIAPPEVMTCTEKKYKCSFLTQSKSWWSAPRPDEHSDLVVFHETDLRRYPPSKPA